MLSYRKGAAKCSPPSKNKWGLRSRAERTARGTRVISSFLTYAGEVKVKEDAEEYHEEAEEAREDEEEQQEEHEGGEKVEQEG